MRGAAAHGEGSQYIFPYDPNSASTAFTRAWTHHGHLRVTAFVLHRGTATPYQ